MTMAFNHVGLLGRREHPGVEEIVSGLLNLLEDRGLQVTIEDRLATLSHFEKREMESRDQIGAMVDLAIVIQMFCPMHTFFFYQICWDSDYYSTSFSCCHHLRGHQQSE